MFFFLRHSLFASPGILHFNLQIAGCQLDCVPRGHVRSWLSQACLTISRTSAKSAIPDLRECLEAKRSSSTKMMVPRSYLYTSASVKPGRWQEKDSSPKSDKEWKPEKTSEKKAEAMVSRFQSNPLNPSPVKPSQPVVIPTRTKPSAKKATREYTEGFERRANRSGRLHDATSMPPSKAALLAMTSISEHGRRRVTTLQSVRANNYKGDIQGSGAPKTPLSSSSPQTWDFLLSPPEDGVLESSSFESDATLGPFSSLHSVSTDSMPSLAEDEDSISSMSNPPTPGSAGNNRLERRKQNFPTSVGEDCMLDHPLLPPTPSKDASIEEADAPLAQPHPNSQSRSKTFFKSNLTASFRAIRSAARSISDFTGPLPHRDDLLSRSVLFMDIPFTDERRPPPSLEPPDPAWRRYLNPVTLSPAELHFHGEEDQSSCKASIQLQTYQPGARRSPTASSPPVFVSSRQKKRQSQLSRNSLDTEDALTSSLSPRQREPRENSDFLRVIVLEMNMRKVGKLSDANPGRAKLWLPARETGRKPIANRRSSSDGTELQRDAQLSEKTREVPKRWASEVT